MQSAVSSQDILHSSKTRYCLKFPNNAFPSPVQPFFPASNVDHDDMDAGRKNELSFQWYSISFNSVTHIFSPCSICIQIITTKVSNPVISLILSKPGTIDIVETFYRRIEQRAPLPATVVLAITCIWTSWCITTNGFFGAAFGWTRNKARNNLKLHESKMIMSIQSIYIHNNI